MTSAVEDFSLSDFIRHPPAEFALLEDTAGDLFIFLGPFSTETKPQGGTSYIYLNDFFLKSDAPWHRAHSVHRISKVQRESAEQGSDSVVPKIEWCSGPHDLFLESYSYFRRLIENKILSKAVPVGFSDGKFLDDPARALPRFLQRLVLGQEGLYSYAFRKEDTMLLGASPEILFALDSNQRHAHSEAVAGSIIKTHAPLSDITGKLRLEHELVVKDLETQMSFFGVVEKGEVSLKSLPSLSHLRTGLELHSASKIEISDFLRRLHPSGALGILPRAPLEHQYVTALEPSGTRDVFGAPFGALLPDGNSIFVVAIRNLIISGDAVRIGAGAGITKDSEENAELAEVLAKQQSVKKFFQLS